ncbi:MULTISPECIES: lasso RiPP family leader peptide-containing protein [unclassified Nocardioides]
MDTQYESPKLKQLGSVKALTLGEGWEGDDDTLLWFIRYGVDYS